MSDEQNSTEDGGGNEDFQKKVELAVAEQVKGLKENNAALKAEKQEAKERLKTLEEQMKAFDGVNLEEYKKFVENVQASEEAKLIAEGKVDDVIKNRTQRMVQDHEAQTQANVNRIKELESQVVSLQTTIDNTAIDNEVRQAAPQAGVLPQAVEDALMHARNVFRYEDGILRAFDKLGTPRYSVDGENPMTPKEWLDTLKTEKPHWFQQASGGGSRGSGSKNADLGENPWKTKNLTKQMEIIKQDPQEAKRLAKEAGQTLKL